MMDWFIKDETNVRQYRLTYNTDAKQKYKNELLNTFKLEGACESISLPSGVLQNSNFNAFL